MNNLLELNHVSIGIGDLVIVEDVTFDLTHGEIGCLLGPSGCGKTTLLRGVAGFENTIAGNISIDGETVSSPRVHQAIETRRVGMVFQDYALFPHLTARENIAFGIAAMAPRDRNHRVLELAHMTGVVELLDEYPHRMSGGQQQRVAVARAMAPRPRLLLLDEPFASLDVALREQIARDIRGVLKEDGITAILVTHNRQEAFAMADKVGVMRAGRLLQWDTPFNLYHRPVDSMVAEFVGECRFITGTLQAGNVIETELGQVTPAASLNLPVGVPMSLLVRPDDLILDESSAIRARVVSRAFRGSQTLYTLQLASGVTLLCSLPSHHDFDAGDDIGIGLLMDHVVVFAN
jgi:iron(III) transport system ATP-binding protein